MKEQNIFDIEKAALDLLLKKRIGNVGNGLRENSLSRYCKSAK